MSVSPTPPTPPTPYTAMSFREIARSYNRINLIPPQAASDLGKRVKEIVEAGHNRSEDLTVLDIGAGAGRIALPIAAAGCTVTLLDSEPAMLAVAADLAAEQQLTVELITGDVTRLPFPDASFDSVFTSNVLHLVADWNAALREAKRVLRPNGIFIQGRDWMAPRSQASILRNELRTIIGTLDPSMRPTAAAGGALFQTLAQMGGVTEPESVAAVWHERVSVSELLRRMASRTYNETWQLSDALLSETLRLITAFAESVWSDPDALNTEEDTERRFLLYVTKNLKPSANS